MKTIRVGIFGAGRGADLAHDQKEAGAKIVALCDFNENRREAARSRLIEAKIADKNDFAVYDDFDKFIEHDMDAVVLANYFHEHAPYAIKCLERGIHVFSECISNGTMAEGIELIRAFEKSNAVYFLAENYPQMCSNREIKRICEGGTLGKLLYAEGEYNHPVDPADTDFQRWCRYFRHHWRNFNAQTYYITHSIGPIMAATGATPKRVTALPVYAPNYDDFANASYVGDASAIITTLNDDGSVFKFSACSKYGAHGVSYRVCGTKGQIENVRGTEKVMLRYNDWNIPEGKEEINFYEPSWDDSDEDKIIRSGHGGADYLTARMFHDCIRSGKQPAHPFNIYAAINMSSVAILGFRSMLERGVPYDIPDLRNEEERTKWENDRLTPFYGSDGSEPTLPCCSHPDYVPTETQLKLYDEVIKEL
ncbi:MAG: Gfo/Idh/MocA family oxidoreductase [Clostridia bacterium]|nr:Gfo/Idh/MocA family oxidoreductase [Clostridia bacterium]